MVSCLVFVSRNLNLGLIREAQLVLQGLQALVENDGLVSLAGSFRPM